MNVGSLSFELSWVFNIFANFYVADGFYRNSSSGGGSCVLIRKSLDSRPRNNLASLNDDLS